MRKFILDFVFNEKTGESKIVIDFNDDSMSALEMNESIRDGQVREDVLNVTESVFGKDIADQARANRIKLVCLDHHPEANKDAPGIALTEESTTSRKTSIEQ
jgi:nanoRNase/pAp phosphatase (c-di-AMP/oligoRNAs hydrolase)